jgi:hypothetical protein
MALRDLVQDLDELGMLLGKPGRAGPYLLGQQQLAARRCGDFGQGDFAGPLVGDGELANLFNGVAEEVDAHWVLFSW